MQIGLKARLNSKLDKLNSKPLLNYIQPLL